MPKNPDNPDSSGNIHTAKPDLTERSLGRRRFGKNLFNVGVVGPLAGTLAPFAQMTEAAAGRGLATRALAGIGLNFLSKESQLRLQELVAPLEQAKTPEQQEAQLLEMSKEFLERYKNCESNGNFVLNEVVNAGSNYNPQFNEVVKDQRRLAARLVEDGVALLSTWGILQGDFQVGYIDKTSKLNFAGRTLAINGSVGDFHLALNLIKARLGLLSEINLLQKDLYREDYEDMMAFLDIDPEMDVQTDSWVIMPAEWMTNIARGISFLDRKNILPPTSIAFDPPDDTGPGVAGSYQTIGESVPFPVKSQVIKLYPRRTRPSSVGEFIDHELGHYVADAARIPERVIGLKPQPPNHQMQYDRVVGKTVLEYLFKLQANGIKKLDDSAFKMFISGYALSGGSLEDLAITFARYCQFGPQFRLFLERLKNQDLDIGQILEAKYNYMKDEISQGEVFSFEQRHPRAEISAWEYNNPNLRVRQEDPLAFYQQHTKTLLQELQKVDHLREVTPVMRVPNDVDQAIAISQPRVWADLLGIPIGDIRAVSAPHPAVSFGLEGKMELKMPTLHQGEVRVPLDTSRSYSQEDLETIFRNGDISISDLFDPNARITAGTADALKSLNLSDVKAIQVFTPKDDHYYIRFAKNPSSGDFRVQPLEVWSSTIHQPFVNKYGESLPVNHVKTSMKSAEKDIILEINNQGKIVQVYHQGTNLGSREVKKS